MKSKKITFQASESSGDVSGLLKIPDGATHVLVFGHGAGAPMFSTWMNIMADKLSDHKIGTFRYNFPYMEQGRKSPNPPAISMATVRSAVEKAGELAEGIPLLAGGKSYGGRMTSQAAAKEHLKGVKGIIFFGFPLHAPGRPSSDRGDHLKEVKLPMLFLQGTRDALANLDLMYELYKGLPGATLEIIEGGDHSFKLPKKMGKETEEVLNDLAVKVKDWSNKI